MRNDDDYGDWLYEAKKDRELDAELELRAEFKNLEVLYEGAIKARAWFAALRYADKMASIASRLGNSHLVNVARKAQERSDRASRAWA